MLAVVHHVKAETVHKDLQSGLVEVRTYRLFLEIYLKQSSEAECHGYQSENGATFAYSGKWRWRV